MAPAPVLTTTATNRRCAFIVADDERAWAADVAQSAHTPQECEIDGTVADGVAHAFGGGSTSFSPADFGATEFGSWSEFFSHVYAYQSRTFQRFRFRTSKTVKARNSKVHDPADKVPESFEHYARGLECIHAGKYKSRGQANVFDSKVAR
ncbi:hypothetical protein PHYSODRAFT_305561 [Phytophthora sojae]|uniref:Uncharacterized protein n=1 Tax=Phytophthora sojae (strain P6497) TaxID=1094619 RepID=G5A5L7_PHYSP|nr:hypothetical protein PHYSODRAFT_305561 [Phytophthora sojae]EGZ08622.1 hypothetical protein PHYSODRAFT_305561 [Phytophthora sojae]|eukprot:XP_009535255.1 hypothetical protein PHYSODRAFT_305561 [Phytophthora sojae]